MTNSTIAAVALALALCATRCVAAAPGSGRPDVRTTGISAGLGLADVSVDDPDGNLAAVELEIGLPGLGTARIPLVRGDAPPGPVGRPPASPEAPRALGPWTARVMLGPAAAPTIGRLLITRRGDPATTPPPETLDLPIDPTPAPAFVTPDWAKGAVWYQIMPERFRNGLPANDPRPGGHPHIFNPGWSSDWYAVSPDEVDAARARRFDDRAQVSDEAARPGGALYNVVFNRRYGGDLQGVLEQLDSIHALGIDALYLTPVFRAPSLHKYDAADYRHIDETLAGTGPAAADAPWPPRWFDPAETLDPATWAWTDADRFVIDRLLPAIHSRAMRVIFDGVWNHTGREFFAFQSLLRDGAASPYSDWYNAQFAGPQGEVLPGPEGFEYRLRPGQLKSWKGWDRRNGGLPAFAQTPDGDLRPGPKAHVFDVSTRWLTPTPPTSQPGTPAPRGIDGFRLDVAADIGVPFWRDWRAHVKRLNPDALLIAEIWQPAGDYLSQRGGGFDGQMNYPFADPVTGWLGRDERITSRQLADRLARVFSNHPATDLVQFNLLGSHDTERLMTTLANPGRPYDDSGVPHARTGPFQRGATPAAVARARLAPALQATYLGAPMIYAGDELGMTGADDPDCRKPLPWPDLPPPEGQFDRPVPGLREVYQQWLTLRRHHRAGPVLRLGNLRHLDSGSDDAFAFERRLNGLCITVVINRGAAPFDAGALLPPGAAGIGPTANSGPIVHATSAGAWLSGLAPGPR